MAVGRIVEIDDWYDVASRSIHFSDRLTFAPHKARSQPDARVFVKRKDRYTREELTDLFLATMLATVHLHSMVNEWIARSEPTSER